MREGLTHARPSTDHAMAITVNQLTAFLAVVRGGSVTAAAQELRVTQPSVSASIAALSRELDSELFVRAGRGIRPTDAGSAFAPYAEDVIGLLEQGQRAAHEASVVAGRKLKIAAVTTAAESFVPPLMRMFGQDHPGLELALDVGNRERVLERVLSHKADVAITGRPPIDDRLIATQLMDNEIACISSPEDPLVSAGPVRASLLADRPWLVREQGSGTRTLAEQFLDDRDMAPITLTLGSNGAIKQAARVGLGVSLVSRGAVQAELSSGLLGEIVLLDPPSPRPWFVLHSAIGPVREPVALFVDFVRRAVAVRNVIDLV